MELSREFGLRANVVEKDYVLGWVLAGIFNHSVIGSSFVFKGGTCLKKCFFETYRFSEDLDFTLSESNHLNQEFLVSCFKEIAQWVYDETGIEIPQDLIRFDVYRNKRGFMSAEGRIGYRGPFGPRSQQRTHDENAGPCALCGPNPEEAGRSGQDVSQQAARALGHGLDECGSP